MKLKEMIRQPEAIFLVGVPGSGKSTKRDQLAKNHVVLSTDDVIEDFAKNNNLNYTQAFNQFDFKLATNKFNQEFMNAIKHNKNILIDQTNLTLKSRAKKLSQIPKQYKKIAYVFEVSKDELIKRLEKREKETGKSIPINLLQQMLQSYQRPTNDEGFDEIHMI